MSAAPVQRRSYRASLYLVLACLLGGATVSLWQLWQASRELGTAEALEEATRYQTLLAEERGAAVARGPGVVAPSPPPLNGDWSASRGAAGGRPVALRVYRKGPPSRPARTGVGDAFEREALRRLREHPGVPFAQIAVLDGKRVLRHARVRPGDPAISGSQSEILELIIPLQRGKLGILRRLGGIVFPLLGGALLGFMVLGLAMRGQGRTLAQARSLAERLGQTNVLLSSENASLKSAERALRMGGAALKLSAAKTRGIVNTAVDGIIVIDEWGVIELFNPAASAIFNYPPEDVVGHEIAMLMPQEGQDNEVAEYIRTGRGQVIGRALELVGCRKDGAKFAMDLALSEMQLGGQRLYTAFVRDITERKRAAEELARARDAALESARVKSEFLANVSHEIRTPLNGVVGITDLLLDTRLTGEQLGHVETIRASADALLAIVNDILDFSKMEAGELSIRQSGFELTELIDGLTDLFAESAANKGVALGAVIHHGTPRKLIGDSGRLRQVLTNLVGNAVKFTSLGHVLLRVTSERDDETGLVLRFAVVDTGPGIPRPAQARLFSAFYQVDGSLTRTHGGTGLGLAISKNLVERMGGTVGLISEPGKGSTFWFTCPLQRQESAARSALGPPGVQGLRALVVVPASLYREVLHYHLTGWGMDVDRAPSLESARSQATLVVSAERRYDLLFLDVETPGAEKGEDLSVLLPELQRTPPRLVLLSQRQSDLARGRWQPNAYLTKPIKERHLAEAIRAALSGEKAPLPEPVAQAPVRSEQPVTGVAARVLLVEDNVINQKVALGQLKKLGYAADVACNGREALSALHDQRYDVVLMDCQMPEMDGYEATRRLREREAGGGRLPVVALTAHALDGEREKCLAAGMDDFLTKPVKIDNLRSVLEHWSQIAATRQIAQATGAATPGQGSA